MASEDKPPATQHLRPSKMAELRATPKDPFLIPRPASQIKHSEACNQRRSHEEKVSVSLLKLEEYTAAKRKKKERDNMRRRERA